MRRRDERAWSANRGVTIGVARGMRRGVAAILFVTAMLVIGTFVLWVFQAVATASYAAIGDQHANGAFYAAESGMELALLELSSNADLDGDGSVGSISNDGTSADDPGLGTGTFHVQHADNRLTSIGAWQGGTRVVEATLN